MQEGDTKNFLQGSIPFDVQFFGVVLALSVLFVVVIYTVLIPFEYKATRSVFEEVKTKQTQNFLKIVVQNGVFIDDLELYAEIWRKDHPHISNMMVYGQSMGLVYEWKSAEASPGELVSVRVPMVVEGKQIALLVFDWNSQSAVKAAEDAVLRMIFFALGGVFLFMIPTVLFFRLMVLRHIQALCAITENPLDDIESPKDKVFVAPEVLSLVNLVKQSQQSRRLDIASRDQSQNLQKYLRAIITHALDGIIVLKHDGCVESMNPMAEKMLKTTENQAKGKQFSSMINIREHGDSEEKSSLPLFTGENDNINGDIKTVKTTIRGDLERYFELSKATFDSEGEKFSVIILRDTTLQHQQHASLEKAKHKTDEAMRAKSRFFAMMSHEIRTPLNGVLGVLQLMQNAKSDQDRELYVTQGIKSAESLKRIIGDLLDISRIEAGKVVLEAEHFSPKKIAEEEVSLAHNLLGGKTLKLMCRVEDGIPALVDGDSGKIRQVIRNMLSNAIKFTEEGGVLLSLSSKPCESSHQTELHFAVQDTGIGIEAGKTEAVFGEFDSVNMAYTRRYGGTGLGMAISKGIVEAMNGNIGFVSKPGKGSKFWFCVVLPIVFQDREYTVKRIDNERTRPGLRILLVEDNPTNSLIAKHMLEREKCKVMTAADGVEALEMLQEFTYDLIFMDVAMPRMDGHEASKAIRQKGGNWKKIPIIALTAHAAKTDVVEAKAAGMSDYLCKPVDQKNLVAMLRKWTRRSQANVVPLNRRA